MEDTHAFTDRGEDDANDENDEARCSRGGCPGRDGDWLGAGRGEAAGNVQGRRLARYARADRPLSVEQHALGGMGHTAGEGGQGDVSGSRIKWRTASGASYVPSILQYEGLLYVTNEIGVVTCARADTGAPIWRLRLGGIFFASPVAGDKKIYLVSETGETIVLRAGLEPEILARNDLGERFIASPAISNGRLFLRSDGKLFAVAK